MSSPIWLVVESLRFFSQDFYPRAWALALSEKPIPFQGSSIYFLTYLLEPLYSFSPISPFSLIRFSSTVLSCIIQIILTRPFNTQFILIQFDLIQPKFAEHLLSMELSWLLGTQKCVNRVKTLKILYHTSWRGCNFLRSYVLWNKTKMYMKSKEGSGQVFF